MNRSNLPAKRNETLTQEFGEMFERFARDFFSPQLDGEDFGMKPSVEVEETERGYMVSAELPGLRPEDINLTLSDNTLVIEGKRETKSKEEKKGYYRSEFSYGSFHRSVPLRADVDNNNIKASFENGILTVELVKKEDGTQKTKKIQITKH